MADGTIIINTKIDDEGAKKGVSSLSGIVSKGLGVVGKAGALIGAGVAAATTAVIGLTKVSVEQYSQYEQLTGGVETLFKKSAGLVERYAGNAYKTAGMSANEYMDTITSFSASLLQGLGGDTEKAAQIGNMAVTDMADNANKMGTDMQSIQNAYAGFAKSNYTMLDNLRLGYGGTKSEMERLLKDATKLTGIKYDINNFSDVINAIHAVQTKLGITGTTAKEAATTIEGSMNMTKAAWTNLMTAMAQDDDTVFEETINDLVYSVGKLGENLVPRIQIALKGIGTLISDLLPQILDEVPQIINSTLPSLVSAGSNIVSALANAIIQSIPTVVSVGIDLIKRFLDGIKNNTGSIKTTTGKIISLLVSGLLELAPSLAQAGVALIAGLAQGLLEGLAQMPVIGEIFNPLQNALQWVIDNSNTVVGALIAIGTGLAVFKIAGVISGFVTALKSGEIATQAMAKSQAILNAVMNLNPIAIVVAAVAALAAAFIYLWNTSEGFRNFWIGLWNSITSFFSSAWNTIAGFFTQTIPAAFNSLVNAAVSFGTGVKNTIVGAFNAIWNFFTQTIPQWITNITNWFLELPENIGYALGFVLGKIIQWGVDAWNYLVTNVPKWINSIGTWFSELPGKIWTWLTNTITKVIIWGTNMITKAKFYAQFFIHSAIAHIKQLPGQVWTWLTNTVSKVVSWGYNFASAGARSARQLFNSVVNGVKSLPGKMLSIGKNIVHGIWNGITGAAGWLKNKITGFGDSIVGGFKSALGIHSPSRVMRDMVGKFIPQGISVGIDAEMPNTIDDIQGNIDDLYSELRGTVDIETAKTTAAVAATNIVNNYSTTNNNNADNVGIPNGSTIIVQNNMDGEAIGEAAYKVVDNKLALQRRRIR